MLGFFVAWPRPYIESLAAAETVEAERKRDVSSSEGGARGDGRRETERCYGIGRALQPREQSRRSRRDANDGDGRGRVEEEGDGGAPPRRPRRREEIEP